MQKGNSVGSSLETQRGWSCGGGGLKSPFLDRVSAERALLLRTRGWGIHSGMGKLRQRLWGCWSQALNSPSRVRVRNTGPGAPSCLGWTPGFPVS